MVCFLFFKKVYSSEIQEKVLALPVFALGVAIIDDFFPFSFLFFSQVF